MAAETYGQLPQTYAAWGTETTFGTAATTIANWELWQSINLETTHAVLPARGLGARAPQQLVTGATDGKLSGDIMLQDMKFLSVISGFTDTTAGTAGDMTHTMVPATTIGSATVEIGHDGTADTIYKATGLMINSWTLNATTEDICKVSVDCIYQDIDATDTTAATPALKTTLPFAIAQLSMKIGNSAVAEVNNMSITVNNNLAPVRGLGTAAIVNLKPAAFDVTGTVNANMRDTTYFGYVNGNTEIDLELAITESATRSITLTMNNVRVSRWSEAVDVGGGIVNCTFDYTARYDSTEASNDVYSLYIVEHNQIATAYA